MSIEIDDQFKLFEIAGWSEPALGALLARLDLPVPQHTGELLAAAGSCILRFTPRLAWVLADIDVVLPWTATSDGVAVDLSNSRLRLHLAGRSAEMLPRLVAVDFDRLGPAAFVASMIHGIPVTILRAAAGLDLLVPRSFATSLVELINDAAL